MDSEPAREAAGHRGVDRAGRILNLAAFVLLGSVLVISVAALIAGLFGVTLLDLCRLT